MGTDMSALKPMVPDLVIARLKAQKDAKHPALERLREVLDQGVQG